MKICKNCKTELEDNQKFCHRCGSNEFEEVNSIISENREIVENSGIKSNADNIQNQTIRIVHDENINQNTVSTAKPITNNNSKLIILISAIIAVVVIIITAVTVSTLKSYNEITTTKPKTTNRVSDNTYHSEEKQTEKSETKKTEPDEESYNSSLWQKNSENSNAYKNSIAYNYIMGPGTFIDKINSVSNQFGLSFKWAGDTDMGDYIRRVFTPGGIRNPNSGQNIGYYIDVLEEGNESVIIEVLPFVSISNYDGDKKQALATLTVMALYAYDEIPLGNQFSTVMDKIIAGNSAFRYNDFLVISQTSEEIFYATVFKSNSSIINKLEQETNVKIENYAY